MWFLELISARQCPLSPTDPPPLISRYKAHLCRKTFDKMSERECYALLKKGQVRLIQDYGQKWEPMKWKETQTFQFGKAGLSQWGGTFLMCASNFSQQELVDMLGAAGAGKIKVGDMVIYSIVLYCNDAKQDWVHSFFCLRAALKLFHDRYPRISEVLIRSDGAGNFKCSAAILAMPALSKWSKLRIVEVSISEAGGGKDLTDSLIQKHKHMLRQQTRKPGGSACTAAELVDNIAAGSRESETGGSCDTAELSFQRPLVQAEEKTIVGISSLYLFKYEYSDAGEFEGMRVWAHRGIGEGRFYPRAVCDDMFSAGGLTEDMLPVLKSATAPAAAPESAASGGGSGGRSGAGSGGRVGGRQGRVLRGDERVLDDLLAKEEAKRFKEEKSAGEVSGKHDQYERSLKEAGVMNCEGCGRVFVRDGAFNTHVAGCAARREEVARQAKFDRLLPPSELAQRNVLSIGSLVLAEGEAFKKVPGAQLHFPKPLWEDSDFKPAEHSERLWEGWALKGGTGSVASAAKGKRFDEAQREFLMSVFDAGVLTGHKIKEAEAHVMMVLKFNQRGADLLYSSRKVLLVKQIKSWLSTECGRRKKLAAKAVFHRGLKEVVEAAYLRVEGGGGEEEEEEELADAGREGDDGEGDGGGAAGGLASSSLGAGGGVARKRADVTQVLQEVECSGVLFVVVKEIWEDLLGFEVWEIEGDGGADVLCEESMISKVRARKWVHEVSLLSAGQVVAETECLMDKSNGGKGLGKLGKPGERRFASRIGRASDMKEIEPGVPALNRCCWFRFIAALLPYLAVWMAISEYFWCVCTLLLTFNPMLCSSTW